MKQLIQHYSSLLKASGELPATSAVVLYHMIYILHNLCLNSPKFVTFFCTELMDEIRYVTQLKSQHLLFLVTGIVCDYQ